MAEEKKTMVLKGNVQHYDWGGTEFIPTLLDIANTDKVPFAEYWMGAHEKSPSHVQLNDKEWMPLPIFIKQNPERILGKFVAENFKKLPYLIKILDVKKMLSIQVHPDKNSAEKGFARENKRAIPLDATFRNYKDDNHKPELIVALSDFWLLHGFKPFKELSRVLKNIAELKSIFELFKKSGLEILYQKVMNMPQAEVNSILNPLLQRIIPMYERGELQEHQEDFWAARAAINFNTEDETDRGIFSIYLLNLLKIKKGEGIFQPPGLLHAYLEGQNVEIMANSDNVLRGGLTTKHIDIYELINQIDFIETNPVVINPIQNGSEKKYETSAKDFQLSCFLVPPEKAVSFKTKTAEIIFVLQGEVTIHSDGRFLLLQKGKSVISFADQAINIQSEKGAEIYKASVPMP